MSKLAAAAQKVIGLKREYLNAREMLEQYERMQEGREASHQRIKAEELERLLLLSIDELEGAMVP